jgi:RimJ/RimL family protein N-acetyltransferase
MGRFPDVRKPAYAYLRGMARASLDISPPRFAEPRITPPAWADTLVLLDGTRIGFRPVTRDDRDGLALLFARMSPQSRYRRYLSPKPSLSPRELTFLTDVDHVRHGAVAAIDQYDRSLVGVGRYVVYEDEPRVADLAVEVADDLQGMGIGSALARRVITRARQNGVARLTATLLWENRPARALLRRLDFQARESRGTEIELELALMIAESPPRALEQRC